MKFIIGLALGFFLYYTYLQRPVRVPASQLAQVKSVNVRGGKINCQNKSQCLVVYLTPWCGACRQFKSELLTHFPKALPEVDPDTGLLVVIGKDNPKKISIMQASLEGMPVMTDADRSLYKTLRGKGVPGFFVLDNIGTVTKRSSGFRALGNTPETATKNFLIDLLFQK